MDRRRREKVIWEMFTENDCYTFADLELGRWKVRADLRKVVILILYSILCILCSPHSAVSP